MSEYRQYPPSIRYSECCSTHVMAMTAEDLHSKADIAAELAYRDIQIAKLKGALRSIVRRFDNADDGGLKSRPGLAWAMASDANDALNLAPHE